MNERIQKLAEQAVVERASGFREFDANVFAQLIVRECAKVAFDDWCEGTKEASSQMAILKHFGVEE